MAPKNYQIVQRYLVPDQGWAVDRIDTSEESTLEQAWQNASEHACSLDEQFGDSHFWTVDLINPETGNSYVQLFHGRLA